MSEHEDQSPDESSEESSSEESSSEEEGRPADRSAVTEKPSDSEIEEIEQERERRLDPDNRHENAEVDNTQRTFEDGEFKD